MFYVVVVWFCDFGSVDLVVCLWFCRFVFGSVFVVDEFVVFMCSRRILLQYLITSLFMCSRRILFGLKQTILKHNMNTNIPGMRDEYWKK
jgi:hypothetical protein